MTVFVNQNRLFNTGIPEDLDMEVLEKKLQGILPTPGN